MAIRVMATTMEMMIMVKDDVASDDAGIDDDDGEHTLQQLQRNWDIWDDDDHAYGDDDAGFDDDDGEHTLQQLHFRECPRYATASQAAWPPLTETATECSHYTINHDEDGNDENGGG